MSRRRRWLLGVEPFFEGGWLHKGTRARRWDVEETLIAVALLGDVSIDLAHVKSMPPEVEITAWAILRDVDVSVSAGTHVELTGWGIFGHRRDQTPPVAARDHVVRIRARTLTPVSDVTVRLG